MKTEDTEVSENREPNQARSKPDDQPVKTACTFENYFNGT